MARLVAVLFYVFYLVFIEAYPGLQEEDAITQFRPFSHTQSQRVNANFAQMLTQKQKTEPNTDPFPHSNELMAALRNKQTSFAVTESQNAAENWDHKSASYRNYETTTTYYFKNVQYLSLDDEHHAATMYEVAPSHVLHCGGSSSIRAGDLLVGTSEGAWMSSSNRRRLSISDESSQEWRAHTNHGSTKGLVFSRRVLAVTRNPVDNECMHVQTEVIHPIDLVERMHIRSKSDLPYHQVYGAPQNGAAKASGAPLSAAPAERKLDHTSSFLAADAPLTLCDDPKWAGGKVKFSEYGFAASLDKNGCVSVDEEVPGSFNFNYDFTSSKAIKAIDLGGGKVSGLSCSQCYLFIGAGVLVDLNYYSMGQYFDFEAKMAGGVGFSVVAGYTNPVLSSSTTIELMGGTDKWTKFPLGNGLTLKCRFAGLNGVVSGSVGGTGTGSMGAGAKASAQIGIMYRNDADVQNQWTNLNTASFSVLPPYFSAGSLKLAPNAAVTVAIIATEEFQLEYVWGKICAPLVGCTTITAVGIEFNFNTVVSAAAQFIANPGATTTAVAVSKASAAPVAALSPRISSSSAELEYHFGDTLLLSASYNGFTPNEEHHFFVSLQIDEQVTDVPNGKFAIGQHIFNSSASGNGVEQILYRLPWDMNFLQQKQQQQVPMTSVSLHASNNMINGETSSINSFVVAVDRNVDTIFTSPTANSRGITADVPFEVQWDSSLLHYFEEMLGTDGHGLPKVVSNVSLIVVSQAYDPATGDNIGNATAYDLLPPTTRRIANNGSYFVTFPSSLLTGPFSPSVSAASAANLQRRFFLIVYSTAYSNLLGWSNGYFTIAHNPMSTTQTDPIALSETNYSAPFVNGEFLWSSSFELAAAIQNPEGISGAAGGASEARSLYFSPSDPFAPHHVFVAPAPIVLKPSMKPTMKPTMKPSPTIMSGSMAAVSDANCASTSCS